MILRPYSSSLIVCYQLWEIKKTLKKTFLTGLLVRLRGQILCSLTSMLSLMLLTNRTTKIESTV